MAKGFEDQWRGNVQGVSEGTDFGRDAEIR
jgi:hypothetical protein